MNRWMQAAAAITVIAIAVVVFIEYREGNESAAWTRLGEARAQEDLVAALESAREAASGTSAEPWTAFDLTMALYEGGSAEEMERASQVARATIDKNANDAVSELLESIMPALESYSAASAGS